MSPAVPKNKGEARRGLLDDIEEMSKRRKKKAKKDEDDDLDLDRAWGR